eukprot:jgi/Mesvir1/21022/Mv08074-RA.1
MKFYPCDPDDASRKLHGSTLVLACPSVANVGQLAVDLLISTLKMKRVGYLDHPAVLQCAGNSPFFGDEPGSIALAVEVFHDKERSLTVVQQRTPFARGQKDVFAADFVTWAKSIGFCRVVLSLGLDATFRVDKHLGDRRIHYQASSADGRDDTCEDLSWSLLDVDPGQDREPADATEHEPPPLCGRLAQKLLAHARAESVPMVGVMMFCIEGDNMGDADGMACALAAYLKLETGGSSTLVAPRWTIPPSWAYLYGPPVDVSLFQ